MKNQNKANAGRTQIADISIAGKELSEEHLRIAGGVTIIKGPIKPQTYKTFKQYPTYAGFDRGGNFVFEADTYSVDDTLF